MGSTGNPATNPINSLAHYSKLVLDKTLVDAVDLAGAAKYTDPFAAAIIIRISFNHVYKTTIY